VRAARSADPVAEVREALARKAPLVVIDDLDAVFHDDARAALARMLTDARLDALERETTLSLIVSCAEPDGADDVIPHGMVVQMTQLSPSRTISYATAGG
jgi:hypothetical protein